METSPFEKSISWWILNLPGTWTPLSKIELSATREKALDRLIRGGFVQARITTTLTVQGIDRPLRVRWRVSGNSKAIWWERVKQYLASKGHTGKGTRIEVGDYEEVRLSADGEYARQDFTGTVVAQTIHRSDGKVREVRVPGVDAYIFRLVSGGPDGTGGCIGTPLVEFDAELHDNVDEPSTPPEQALNLAVPMGGPKVPKAFISYAWDDSAHKRWVAELATLLRSRGVDITLDQWHLVPGDQLPAFMEQAIRENDFVLIICTPKYRQRSDERTGGVGYEGDIMTAEVASGKASPNLEDRKRVDRKFIPILRRGTREQSLPSWLSGKYFINLSGDPYSPEQFDDLLTTLQGRRPEAPPIGPPATGRHLTLERHSSGQENVPAEEQFDPIKILGIVADEVSTPRNDGTRGSALYAIPFKLSRPAPIEWARFFKNSWQYPREFTSMHRPGIIRVTADRVILDGTTIEEVREHHRKTLLLAQNDANNEYGKLLAARRKKEDAERQRQKDHDKKVRDAAEEIDFDT